MGTGHATCVILNNKIRVAQYGPLNGGLEIGGTNVLKFLHQFDQKKFTEKVKNLKWITQEQADRICSEAWPSGYDQIDRLKKLHPELSHSIGSKILQLIQDSDEPLQLENYFNFARMVSSCAWVYVVDLDNSCLEVYTGDITDKPIVSFLFSDLPTEEDFNSSIFISLCAAASD